MSGSICDVCGKPAIGCASSACGPITFAYCEDCARNGAEPYHALVAYLAGAVSCGADLRPEAVLLRPYYYRIINATVNTAGKTHNEFYADIDAAIAEYDAYVLSQETEELE